jgi:hypothetical protein
VSFAGIAERPMPTTRLCRSALMSFTALATVSAGCGPVDPPRAEDADISMDGAVSDASSSMDGAMHDAISSTDTMDDPNCYGPDTGYGSPPWGWCCNADCCHGPTNWFACPNPHPDGGGDR